MGIPLLSGRLLDERDTDAHAPGSADQRIAGRAEFHGKNPIGKRLHVGPTNRPWYIVVGVVGDVKQDSLAIDQPNAVYLSTEQTWFADDALSFVVRTRGDPAALAPAIKNAIWSVDKNQPIVRVATMDALLAVTDAQRSFVLDPLRSLRHSSALALAAVGMYGVLAGSVVERTREIGVRAALGASRSNILALILRDGMRLTAFGILIGLGGAVVASHALVSLLYGISRLDWITWLGVVALLTAVAGVACWIPAWRAARVDPSITLRAE